jgi:hypothetical protein
MDGGLFTAGRVKVRIALNRLATFHTRLAVVLIDFKREGLAILRSQDARTAKDYAMDENVRAGRVVKFDETKSAFRVEPDKPANCHLIFSID